MKRIWLWFLGTFLLLIGANFAYMKWRETSFEPILAPVDLSKPARYSFSSRRFHSAEYYAGFWFTPDVPVLDDWWTYQDFRLFQNQPPEIELRVFDASGARVLEHIGPLSKENGWILTGAGGHVAVRLYKLEKFDARFLAPYRAELTVRAGSAAASLLHPELFLATNTRYVLLPNALLMLLLLVLMVLGSAIILGVQMRRRIRRAA